LVDSPPDLSDVLSFLERLIQDKYGVAKENISPEKRIREDFRIDGDDAVELFDAFHDRFAFEANDFRYDDYFAAEGFSLGLVDWLKGKKQKPLKPMTVQMLVNAALTGVWSDMPTSRKNS
jgi:acyl carrier protein